MPTNLNFCRKSGWLVICVLITLPFSAFPFYGAFAVVHSPSLKKDTIIGTSKVEWGKLFDSVLRRQRDLGEAEDREAKNLRHMRRRHQRIDSSLFNYIKESINQMDTAIRYLRCIGGSSQDYALDSVKDTEISYTCYRPVKEFGKGEIIFHIHPRKPANFLHETTHGAQFERGSIVYTEDGAQFYGVDYNDEIEAFKHEFAYDRTSVFNLPSTSHPVSFDSITVDWLIHVKDPLSDSAVYSSPLFASRPIDVNSDTIALNGAYQNNKTWRRRNLLYPLKDSTYFHFLERSPDECLFPQTTGYRTCPPNQAIIPTPTSIADSSISNVGVCTPEVMPFSTFMTPSR